MIIIKEVDPVITLPDFSDWEFDCKCCCGLNNMQALFLWKLQYCRTEAGVVFDINSGTRCPSYNASDKIKGKPTSDHLTGQGADIATPTSRHRFKILEAAFRAGFRRMGIYKSFIHLGDNPRNTEGVTWYG